MTMRGLQWGLLQIPLGAGLDQKGDARASNPPALDICTDAQFDEIGGLQTRYPFAAIGNSIHGGGTISNARKLVANGDELLCFTEDALYSWSPQLSAWINKGTHLAIKVDERSRFASPEDRRECDRAELDGTIVYSWNTGSQGYVAALDKESGSVIMEATALAGSASRLRLTALATKILLTFYDGVNGLYAYALDPAEPATALAGSSATVTNASYGEYYDIVKIAGADSAAFASRQSPTTSYTVGTITAGLVVTTSSKARTCDGPIAVSVDPTGTHIQIARGSGATIEGDLVLVSTLADVYTAQAIGTTAGTPINQIALAHRSVAEGGAYRAYAFWSALESTDANGWSTKYNYVTTANALGTEDDFRFHLAPVSRAFDHDGSVYVWLGFAGATNLGSSAAFGSSLQNTYFLYRDDATLQAKAVATRAGGFSDATAHLPGVASTGTGIYSWCGTERRFITLGAASAGYSARVPRDIAFTFDSNEARRCARLGRTLYVTGGEILGYDGNELAEIGFNVWPWDFALTTPAGTSHPDGDYAYKGTWRWENAAGETERSSSVIVGIASVTGGPKAVAIGSAPNLATTRKSNVSVEWWRTTVNPTSDAPFYLVTSRDPGDTGLTANEYIVNDPSSANVATLGDALTDTQVASRESHPENGGILESLAPPPATIIAASQDRIFLAGVAGDPDRVWYSRLRGDGEVCAFHDALTIAVPPEGGAITGLAFLNETLIVFRERAAYAFPGDGYANDGSGTNYGPARTLSIDVGAVNAESIATIADGSLLFKSSKGWYVLNRGWGLDYVGGPVSDYDDEDPLAVHVLTNRHQIRILTSARMLVWDYLVNQWGEWTISDGISAAMWNGTHHYLTSTEIKAEQSSYSGVDYGMDIETAWIKLGDQMQAIGRVRRILMLGEYQSDHVVRIRVARDYKATASDTWDYFDDTHWTVSPTTVGGPEQVRIGPSQQQCQAIKIRITVRRSDGSGGYTTPNGAGLKISGLALEVGQKRGVYSMLPAAQKT